MPLSLVLKVVTFKGLNLWWKAYARKYMNVYSYS